MMISECRPELGVHSLLKVNDARGECLGQVVIGFGDYLRQVTEGKVRMCDERAEKARVRNITHAAVAFSSQPCTVTSTMPMTKGGKKVGELTAVFNLCELFRANTDAAGGGAVPSNLI